MAPHLGLEYLEELHQVDVPHGQRVGEVLVPQGCSLGGADDHIYLHIN
jgi:hypothetical protein